MKSFYFLKKNSTGKFEPVKENQLSIYPASCVFWNRLIEQYLSYEAGNREIVGLKITELGIVIQYRI